MDVAFDVDWLCSLIIASISGFGADGPLASEHGHDLNFLALSGLLDQVKKTQTLQTKAAKTTLLQAQAVVRKTQMLDPDALKDFGKPE